MLLEIDGDIILDKEKLRKRYEETNSVEEYVDTNSVEILDDTNSNLDEKASSEVKVKEDEDEFLEPNSEGEEVDDTNNLSEDEDEFLEPDSEGEDEETDSEWVLGDTDDLNGVEYEETYNEEVLNESGEINSAGGVLDEFLENNSSYTDNSGEELNNEGVQGDINTTLDEDEFLEPDSVEEVLDEFLEHSSDTNSISNEDEEANSEEVQDNISTSDEDEFLEPDSEDEEIDSDWVLGNTTSISSEEEEANSEEVQDNVSSTSNEDEFLEPDSRGINDCTEPDISKIENEKQVVEVEKTSLDKEKINSEEENTTNIPTDLREFVKLNRFCDISLALQYFSKKEIEKQLCLGRVYKRKNKLFI